MAFVPLFCHSHHSPRGVASPVDLVRRARNLGYNTLGLCDETTIAGYHDFDEACHAQGIRPVFGCRLFMTGLALTDETFPIDFLIETEQGYRNLVRLLTRYHARGEGEARPLRLDDLRDRTHGLEAVLPADGEMPALIEARDRAKTELFLKTAIELFGGRVALAATHSTAGEIAQAALIARLGRFANLKTLAGRHVYYPEPGDAAAAVFLEHKEGAPGRSYTPPEDVKSLPALWPEDEALARWTGELEELPHEAGNFARRCTWRPARIRRAFPSMDLERGYDPNSYLFDLVIRGATQRYGEITDALKQRINREIEEIKAQNLAPYLLLCHQLAGALDEKGISRGVGRGRVVASVLAYCLGISRIDPVQYSLFAKNLIGEGEVFPAVMVEIPGSSAEGLVTWLLEVYGEEHVAEIGRIQDLRRDQMINELATWAGMTEEERRLTHREKARLRSAGAAQRLDEMLAEGARARRWRDPALIGDLAARLAPRPRHWLGTGDRFVLSGEPLETMVPKIRSHQGKPVTGIEEAAIDRLGLARIVFVPHQLLDILDQAMHAARAQNTALDFRAIPLDNRATFELLGRGDTIGIPPLEGVTLRCLLRKSQPTNILQLWRIKTEAIACEADERPRDISEELPDVLLSYQCAYLKANYPLAFYSAAIGSVIEQGGDPSALMRAARRAGTEVHPPNINLSDWGPTVHAGHIRLGLACVRAFGRRAWENVQAVRSGGHFTSLENFCERVDTRILNVRLLRNLIASGAMDSFEQNRAAMDAVVSLLQRRAREQAGEPERGEAQASLFDMEEWAAEQRREPAENQAPAIAEWNPWEKLQHEFDALGFFLSIDPIRRFKSVLEHLRPLHVEELSPKHVGHPVRQVGLVCSVESEGPLIQQEGDVMMDLEGLPVLIPRHLAEISAYCLEPATEVLITGPIRRSEGYIYLHAEGIWRLADLEDQATKVSSIALRLAGENRQTLKLLIELVKRFPGQTGLKLEDYGGPKGWTFRRLAGKSVFFCSPLYIGLCKILPTDAIELYGPEGERLLVKAPPAAHDPDADEDAPGGE